MYGCSDPVIVYGWKETESDSERVICYEWLEKYGLSLYATEIIRNNACQAVYGIPCSFDSKVGKAIIGTEEKERVEKAFNDMVERYYKKNNKDPPELEYNYAVSGDMSWDCLEEYDPYYKEEDSEDEYEDSSNYKEFIGKKFDGSNVEEFIKERGMYMRKITIVELEEGLEEDIDYGRIDVWVNDSGIIYRMENG